MQPLCLIGYPGAGKSRFKRLIADQVQALGGSVRETPGLVWDVDCAHEQAWLVLDARQRLTHSDELSGLLHAGDVLVLMFWQEVPLDIQAGWLKQLRTHVPDTPYALVMNMGLTDAELTRLAMAPTRAINPDWPVLMRHEFKIPKLVLEHFTFVVDAMQRDPQIKLWRACGVLNTMEFANRVRVEAARTGFYQHDAGDEPAGWLRLEGECLPLVQLDEWLRACYAPGG